MYTAFLESDIFDLSMAKKKHLLWKCLRCPASILLLCFTCLALPPGTWVRTGDMQAARVDHSATKMSVGRVLVAGGTAQGAPIFTAEEYEPQTGSWTTVGGLVEARAHHSSTELSGRVLVTGGVGANGAPLASAELYDMQTRTWSLTGSMATARLGHTATLLNSGKVLVVGGRGPDGQVTGSAELYDPQTGAWTSAGSLATARTFHTTMNIYGTVFVVGGYGPGGYLASVEQYDSATGTWSAAGSLITPRANHTMSLFVAGNEFRILVAGGEGDTGALTSAELWTQSSPTWRLTASMALARTGHAAISALPAGGFGQVVSAGGFVGDQLTSSVEVYNARTDNWSFAASLPGPARSGHQVTGVVVGGEGALLLEGGLGSGGEFRDSYLFTPAPPVPPVTSIIEFQPLSDRAGRTVAVTIEATNSRKAIVASESGGLFTTSDGGNSWSHIDAFTPIRMSDVEFPPPGFVNPQVVIATTSVDGNPNPALNAGGIWASSDEGASWTKVTLPTPCSKQPINAFRISYLAPASVYVATDCGIIANTNVGASNWIAAANWSDVLSVGMISVVAHNQAGPLILDMCRAHEHIRMLADGTTRMHIGPACDGPFALAASPLEPDVLFASGAVVTPRNCSDPMTVLESDDAGAHWNDIVVCSASGRPRAVLTHMSPDQNPAHFEVYYSGRLTTCSTTPDPSTNHRCPSNNSWKDVPVNYNHDIDGLAWDPSPGNCPLFSVGDYNVMRRGAGSASDPCGEFLPWTASSASSGLGALQVYDIAGQVQYPVTRSGAPASPYTTVFAGTQDNAISIYSDASKNWQAVPNAIEDSFLQVAPSTLTGSQPSDLQLTMVDFGCFAFCDYKSIWDAATNSWTFEAWTGPPPSGSQQPAFWVAPDTYVEWSGSILYLLRDSQPWKPLAALPPQYSQVDDRILVALTPKGPAILQLVTGPGGDWGIARLERFLDAAPVPPLQFVVESNPSQLQSVGVNGFGQGPWYKPPVFSADPGNYLHLYAADQSQNSIMVSPDAGATWTKDDKLTNLVLAAAPFRDSLGYCQVHVIAFDPRNPSHILVGTDQAGIMASPNGGLSWSALTGTNKATAITSFYFDDRTNTVYLGTYGRGLWKLTVDWSSLPGW
jgi:hypothetical protein